MRGLVSALAIAMIAGATSAAMAGEDQCLELFGPVAGNGGYWVFVPGTTTTVLGDEVLFSGNSGNGFVSVTEVTTPGQCQGYNKSDNSKGEDWYYQIGEYSETSLDPLKVCQNVRGGGSTQTPETIAIGDYDCTL